MCCFDTNTEEAACIYVKFFFCMLTSVFPDKFKITFHSCVYTHTHTHTHTHTRTHGMWKHSQTAVCFIKLTIFT